MLKKILKISLALVFVSACKQNSTANQTAADTTKLAQMAADSLKKAQQNNSLPMGTSSGNTYHEYLKKENFEEIADWNFYFVRPNYAFFGVANEENQQYEIEIYQKENGNWKQTGEKKLELSEVAVGSFEQRRIDINGDGTKDLLILMDFDGRGNHQFTCFLEDPTTHVFEKVEKFEELYDPEFDPKKKVLQTRNNYHRGATEETFRWEGKKLKFVSGIEFSPESERKYTKQEN